MWSEKLTQSERDSILSSLSDKQSTFIKDYLKRGRRTVFANVLAKEKASSVESESIEQVASRWELIEYLDAGPDWQANSQLFCECGRPLRYQYIVQNLETGEILKFGINHFEDHTGITPTLVKEIIKGVDRIDFEMDEVLNKISTGWSLTDEGIKEIPSQIEIPKDIREHFDYDVPLLDRQVNRLREKIQNYLREQERSRLHALVEERKKREDEHKKQWQEIATRTEWEKKTMEQIPLEKDLQIGVLVYLKMLQEPEFDVSELCEELINYHEASSERYSSGTPMIFGNVCIFLEQLVQQGMLELVEKDGPSKRKYRLLELDNFEGKQDIDVSQLSLFD